MAIKCPKCRTENPETQRFCGKCGTQLATFGKSEISVTRTIETSVEELGRGTTFAGRYEIVELLGTGGMGAVYRVFDKKLEEEVALKLIRPDIAANRKTIERFKNEIKIARKITDKHVCRMHDLGEAEGTSFITMEYVPGQDLRGLMKQTGQLSATTAVSIARQIAEGLSEAHKLGIIHRDLKPGNIMIDKDGQAKIMDFGIARSLLGKGMTGEGAIVGTPEYMSPEQVEGKETDPRSDIYSLGIILYETLIGRPPFEGETPFSVANKHKTEPPPIPKKIIPQLPEELNKLILRCLEKDKSKRYQTAEELIADLSAVELTLPSTDRALTRAKTKIRTSREITVKLTPRKLIIPAAIIALLAIAVVAALTFIKPERRKIDSIAILPLEDLSTNKGEGFSVDGLHDALINEMYNIPSVRIIDRQSVMRYKDTQKTIPQIAGELKVAGILRGSVVQSKDRVRISMNLYEGVNGDRLWGNSFDRNPSDIFVLYNEFALTTAREIHANLPAQDAQSSSHIRKVDPEAYALVLQVQTRFNAQPDPSADWTVEEKKTIELLQKSVEKDPNFALSHALLANYYVYLVDCPINS